MLPIYLAMLDGDEEKSKFESLYLTYRKLMFHVANGILNDEGLAEDAVHQAFLKILENFDKMGEISCHKTRSYVVIIVRNAAINMYNRRKRHSAVPIEEAAFCAAEEKSERTDDLDSLAEAVLKLPVIYKDALKLKYVQGFSNSEIAGMLGISEAAVRKRLERARRMLEENMERGKTPMTINFTDDMLREAVIRADIRELEALPADRGSDIFKGAESYEVVRVSEKQIKFAVTVEIYEDPTQKNVTGYKQYDFFLEFSDGRWRFTNFKMVR